MARESKRKIWRCFTLCATLVFLVSCAGPQSPLPYIDKENVSTKFFRELFTGRVYVSRWVDPPFLNDDGPAHAAYFQPDGKRLGCFLFAGRYLTVDGRWAIEASGDTGAALRTWARKRQRGRGRRGHSIIRYWPSTGRLHIGRKIKRRTYRVYPVTAGWIQDSFPRSLRDACPNLPLPDELAINEKQTSLDISEIRPQDPDAPISDFPGSDKLPKRRFFGFTVE